MGSPERWRGLLLGLLLVFVGAVVVYWITSRYAEDIAALMTRIAAIAGTVAALVATVGRAVQAALSRVTEFQRSLNENLERQPRNAPARFGNSRRRLKKSVNVSRNSGPRRSGSSNASRSYRASSGASTPPAARRLHSSARRQQRLQGAARHGRSG